ncbi:MAG: aminopeptidase P N-terminal domain-containing protein [Candidatus Saccharimonadales bacterium]
MKSFFSSGFFANNRRRLQKLSGSDAPIVVTANGLLQKSNVDGAYTFSQDADFWYLTGIDEPDIVLVLDRGDEYLIVPPRPGIRETFDGKVAAGPLTRRSGIRTVLDEKTGWERLGKRLNRVGRVSTPAPAPAYTERYGIYANPARANLVARLRSYGRPKLTDLSPHLSQMRVIKQPPELKAMQAAVDITVDAMKEALAPAKRRAYRHEYELEAELTRGFRRRGAGGHSFDPIVAGGKRACTLHNVANEGELHKDELVVVDVGAEVEHYAADITRTVSLGKPSARQREVHAAVLEVQRFALGLLKPGTTFKDYEQQVRRRMGEQLLALGLIRANKPENVHKFYPHGTSHFIGLYVHDAGDHERPLEPGMVMSCEPGIYIPKEGIGVRIEDDVLITRTGNQVLTDKMPRGIVQ